MTYNLSNYTSANNFLDLTVAANQLVDGWLATLIILMIVGITFVAMKNFETKHALLTSSFISFVLTGSLWGAGVASERALVIAFVFLLFSLIFSVISD